MGKSQGSCVLFPLLMVVMLSACHFSNPNIQMNENVIEVNVLDVATEHITSVADEKSIDDLVAILENADSQEGTLDIRKPDKEVTLLFSKEDTDSLRLIVWLPHSDQEQILFADHDQDHYYYKIKEEETADFLMLIEE
ncbi:hypothetical protein [Shouchella clausii]|uniref:hypothetical protein n=1 Tax=Shouchella clausii TaxID=79880 RepID=UPI000B97C199|nr:hypothetical protein [Shouchella clausii]PAD44488.1 hypothetical protein CHH54_02455 [Bacillus sp. 7520-S]SPT79444.1 Uncharacterised protein [Niallia circulans]AST95004.1 hypothetical protein BC8716_03020 [Shouchella clausii]MCM3549209.1 hypothetical protein [Shouchella clausii]MCR1288161.1 hypothetical protein [Shouchella clausii]